MSLGPRPLLLLSVLALCAAVTPWATHRLLSAGLFLRLEGPNAGPALLAGFGAQAVQTRPCAEDMPAPCHAYLPAAGDVRDGIVLAHGIHEAGIDEPRLVALANALASAGFHVVTPLLKDLSEYRVTHAGAEVISRAATALARELGRAQVTVFGISFGGGLALRAACERSLRAPVGRVIALGAHHDVARVARFFLGEPARGPHGERADVDPHPYGRVVIWRSLFEAEHKGAFTTEERAAVEAALKDPPEELLRASPSGCAEAVQVPVFLVHGLGDRVIPFTETLWNADQLGRQADVVTLVSAAIAHAEYKPPGLSDRLRLVDFMAKAAF